jgi:putative hydrolase of HD superfamily
VLTKEFALKLFNGFSIQRWNDMARPVELTEMDKAGLKMMTAYLIGHVEIEAQAENGVELNLDWESIIFAGFFDLLKRIALSDIKSSVHHRIRNQFPEEFQRLNNWVLEQYKETMSALDPELYQRFTDYLLGQDKMGPLETSILTAAHDYATFREFELIKLVNVPSPQLNSIEKELNAEMMNHLHLKGMGMLVTKQRLYELLQRLEQLRFQIRWSHTQRIPRTSVLGHSMLVACFALLLTRQLPDYAKLKNPAQLLYANYFGGLFHDLPESVIRDIVSPVKRATVNLPEIVKQIEDSIVREELYPLMSEYRFKDELMAFTNHEFEDRVVMATTNEPEPPCYTNEDFMQLLKAPPRIGLPIMGSLVGLCDEYAAFLEAYQSIYHGISSNYLKEAANNIRLGLLADGCIGGLNVATMFEGFRSFDVE